MEYLKRIFNDLGRGYANVPFDIDHNEAVVKLDAIRECQKINKRANELLCALYKCDKRADQLLTSPETIINGRHKFQIFLQLPDFKPGEVKATEENGLLVVSGSHPETQDDHGFVMREFTRKYHIPPDVNADEIVCTFHPEGFLVVEACKRDAKLDARQIHTKPLHEHTHRESVDHSWGI